MGNCLTAFVMNPSKFYPLLNQNQIHHLDSINCSGINAGAIDVSIKTNYKDNIEYNPSKKTGCQKISPPTACFQNFILKALIVR